MLFVTRLARNSQKFFPDELEDLQDRFTVNTCNSHCVCVLKKITANDFPSPFKLVFSKMTLTCFGLIIDFFHGQSNLKEILITYQNFLEQKIVIYIWLKHFVSPISNNYFLNLSRCFFELFVILLKSFWQ